MKRFKKVYIEITNICNLSCDFCPKTNRKAKWVNEKEFEYVLNQVKPYTDYVYLHLMGEPCAHPQIETFLKMTYEKGLKVNLTTNGTLIHKVKDILIDAPALRQVNISLHSFEANNQVVELQKYVDEIIQFIKEATEKSKIICSIRLWNMDSDELKGSNELNEDIISMLEKKLEIDFKIREKLLEKQGIKLAKNVYLNMAEKFEWPDINKEEITKEAFCYGLRDQIGILADGTVVPCCLDSEGNIPLGNIYETALQDILGSKRAIDIYEGFSRRCAVEELCKRCGYAQRYK